MKKRALSVLLAAAMVSTMLAGCSGGSSDSSSASADASATDGNVVKIGVYEPASGDNGAGGKQEHGGGGGEKTADGKRSGHFLAAGPRVRRPDELDRVGKTDLF